MRECKYIRNSTRETMDRRTKSSAWTCGKSEAAMTAVPAARRKRAPARVPRAAEVDRSRCTYVIVIGWY